MWGIAFTDDGNPTGRIVGWKETLPGSGVIALFDDRDAALLENDLTGWTGYVREYVKVAEERVRSRSGQGESLGQEVVE